MTESTKSLADAKQVILDHELVAHLAMAQLAALNVWYETRIKPKSQKLDESAGWSPGKWPHR